MMVVDRRGVKVPDRVPPCAVVTSLRARAVRVCAALLGCLLLSSCGNDPYRDADQTRKILYSSFTEAPRTLDPAVAYTTAAHVITANVFDSVLEYHYRKRPYELIAGLAEAVPAAEPWLDGRVAYRFRIRDGVQFHDDPCFGLNGDGAQTRPVRAADFVFALMRLADPKVNSPIKSSLVSIAGFAAFGERLEELRKTDPDFSRHPAHEQYALAGGMDGIEVSHELAFEIVLNEPDPQILFWFAMPFTTPTPWEAVAYYDGNEGRARLADHPVGTGPYRLSVYDKQFRFVLERNPGWYGLGPAGANAPGAVFPADGEENDIADGLIDPDYVGKRLPFLERIEFRRERESIPRFNKFLQGYYDNGGIIAESFDAVIQDGRLSPEMAGRGMSLDRVTEPSVFYIGYNMDDATVGRAAGVRGRKLRQAMSLVIDSKQYLDLFENGRGVPAQSPLPPGLFGHEAAYVNPYRQVDLAQAKVLLRDAGYDNGIDPDTGQPLKLTFDTGNTTSQAKLRYQYFINSWRQLGLDVEMAATNYNQFQAKVRRGAYQIFTWGWIADYPDPANFLFLLEGAMARSESGGPNTANFKHLEYDRLFNAMKDRANDQERAALIKSMLAILERERPWIELNYREAYILRHGWLKNAKPLGLSYPVYKYLDIDLDQRGRLRGEWNQPITWPVYVLLLGAVLAVVPGIRTFYRERQ